MFYNFSWFDKFYNNIKYYFLFAIYLRHFLRMWMRINVCRNQWWSSSVMKQDIWLDTIYCFLVWHLLLIWQISWFTTPGRYYSSVMGSDKNKKKRACRRNNRTNKQVNKRKKACKKRWGNVNENDRPVVEDSGGKIENEQDDSETLTGPLLRQPLAAKWSVTGPLLCRGPVNDHLAAKGCLGFVMRELL